MDIETGLKLAALDWDGKKDPIEFLISRFNHYKLDYDKQCGYGERAKDCMVNIADTLTAVAPEKLQEIKDKVHRDLFYGVDTNANNSTDN